MKMTKSLGDNALPWATPVSKVIVAHASSFGCMRTDVLLYIASSKSTSGILYARIIAQSALWLMLLKAFLKSISILKKRCLSLYASCVIQSILAWLTSTPRPCRPPACPGTIRFSFSVISVSLQLMTWYTSCMHVFNSTIGLQSLGLLLVSPPLWSRLTVPLRTSSVRISAPLASCRTLSAHSLSTLSSS